MRGLFVVLEGVDRSGKSTQCVRLKEWLEGAGRTVDLWRFPDRSTEVGGLIDRYLKREIELDDRAVHLLFSANRWEMAERLQATLDSGTDVVCDRYAFSGVAFSAAKPDLDVDWCKAPDAGLPAPDLVLFLDIDHAKAQERGGFGAERYEVDDLQRAVKRNFDALENPLTWRRVDAAQDVDQVHRDIRVFVQEAIDKAQDSIISRLW
ncbi:hypothetical protein CTAYLR_010218 [Chrysophaeum taylorii]|uniref:Thymidylate kinase n=1 Tax=Chrysophaeum taylorii TaxID=2483200 RepID=A0AAD7U7H8_9STRA|nr:hypothetical protein CTAYLR_010218 [Chrysophaeum taylorii]